MWKLISRWERHVKGSRESVSEFDKQGEKTLSLIFKHNKQVEKMFLSREAGRRTTSR